MYHKELNQTLSKNIVKIYVYLYDTANGLLFV